MRSERIAHDFRTPSGGADARHTVQLLDRIVRQRALGRGEILLQLSEGRGAEHQKDVGGAAKQPGERALDCRGAEALSDVGQGRRLQRV